MATAHRDEVRPPAPFDLDDDATARQVLALQREAYAVEAALIGSDGIPVMTEAFEELRAARRGFTVLREREVVPGLVIAELGRGTSRNGEDRTADRG
jgi:hypothetical protein